MTPTAVLERSASTSSIPFVVSLPTRTPSSRMTETQTTADVQPLSATPELLAYLAAESQKLETATPWEIVQWAVDHYFPKLTMATAFGPEGCVIIHMLGKIEPRVHVFNLDTGYQFKETLELRDKIAARYGITVEYKRPATTVEEYEAQHEGQI